MLWLIIQNGLIVTLGLLGAWLIIKNMRWQLESEDTRDEEK
jgi:uncharacterized membrane protein YjgN (DUF898 family)